VAYFFGGHPVLILLRLSVPLVSHRTSLTIDFLHSMVSSFRSFQPPTSPFVQPSQTEYSTVGFVAAHLAQSASFLGRRSDGSELTSWFVWNEFESGGWCKFIFCSALPLFLALRVRAGERFRDGQYSLVSFLFAVFLLTVPPPVSSHL